MKRWRRRTDTGIDQAIANVTWNKPPAPAASPRPVPANPAPPGPNPPHGPAGPAHRRGHHMVIDTWECGCIYTWTRQTGWTRDFDCIDEQIRKLLTS